MFSKSLKLVLLATTVLFTFGCSSDDDSNNNDDDQNNQSNLVGTWNIVTLVSDLPLDIDGDSNASADLHTEIDCITEQFIFNADGTWSGDTEFALSFFTELQSVICLENDRAGTWTLNENMLTFTAAGIDRTFPILLTENTLSFDLLGDLPTVTTVVIGTYTKQ